MHIKHYVLFRTRVNNMNTKYENQRRLGARRNKANG